LFCSVYFSVTKSMLSYFLKFHWKDRTRWHSSSLQYSV